MGEVSKSMTPNFSQATDLFPNRNTLWKNIVVSRAIGAFWLHSAQASTYFCNELFLPIVGTIISYGTVKIFVTMCS